MDAFCVHIYFCVCVVVFCILVSLLFLPLLIHIFRCQSVIGSSMSCIILTATAPSWLCTIDERRRDLNHKRSDIDYCVVQLIF